ncbi:MAG: hypothetical protein KDD64_06045 [Bdellovibrionales bacterium]|nr:hypothetical protein [Bdellovibrionales bacterium]
MKILPRRKKKIRLPKDSKKESLFRLLRDLFSARGYEVRREKLKQGHGFRVSSGQCRLRDDRLIFVDQRLAQDDQIDFLVSQLQVQEFTLLDEELESLPVHIRSRLVSPLSEVA